MDSTVAQDTELDAVPAKATPGTKDADGNEVLMKDAVVAWAVPAREALERTAAEFNGFITYKELADEVQDRTGITTRSLLKSWIGKVLRNVSDAQLGTDEPNLTSLAVTANQEVGPGYSDAAESRTGSVPEDLELAAATERLACYRYFGADVPADAEPALTPSVAAARMAELVAAKAAMPKPVCSGCFMQLPLTGVCGICDDD